MPTHQINPDDVKIAVNVSVLHNPGSVRLDAYPLLVHAPGQHGPEVVTEDKGMPVSSICNALSVNPDVVSIAARFGTTPEHVTQAVAYAHAAGLTALSHANT
jgi:hypothetical protein